MKALAMVRNHSILVVDDEPSVCFLLKEELSELKKFDVFTANDGVAAMNALQQRPFDVVLLDERRPSDRRDNDFLYVA